MYVYNVAISSMFTGQVWIIWVTRRLTVWYNRIRYYNRTEFNKIFKLRELNQFCNLIMKLLCLLQNIWWYNQRVNKNALLQYRNKIEQLNV